MTTSSVYRVSRPQHPLWCCILPLTVALLTSGCGVTITAQRVQGIERDASVLKEPGVYYFLPKTLLQVSIPVDYVVETIDLSDGLVDRASCDNEELKKGIKSQPWLRAKKSVKLRPAEITTVAIPDRDHMYRVSAETYGLLAPFTSVSHTLELGKMGILKDIKSEVTNNSVEFALGVVGALSQLLATPAGDTPEDQSSVYISCPDLQSWQDLRANIKNLKEHRKEIETILFKKPYREPPGKDGPALTVLELIDTDIDTRRKAIADIKVRWGIGDKKVVHALTLFAKNKEKHDANPNGGLELPTCLISHCVLSLELFEGSQATNVQPPSLSKNEVTISSLANEAIQVLMKSSFQIGLKYAPSIAPSDTDSNAAAAATGYAYRVPVPTRIEVFGYRNDPSQNPGNGQKYRGTLFDGIVEIAQFGQLARLPDRFTGSGGGVELTLSESGGATRVHIGSKGLSAEPIISTLDKIGAASLERKKLRKEEEKERMDAEKDSLAREKEILQSKKEIRDLKKDLGIDN